MEVSVAQASNCCIQSAVSIIATCRSVCFAKLFPLLFLLLNQKWSKR